MRFPATVIIVVLLFNGCTWVETTPEGEHVRIVSQPTEVEHCKKIGNTTVSLLDKVGYFKRDQEKVEGELAILGCNSAAKMGGDTILPVSEVLEGERSYEVYRCGSSRNLRP